MTRMASVGHSAAVLRKAVGSAAAKGSGADFGCRSLYRLGGNRCVSLNMAGGGVWSGGYSFEPSSGYEVGWASG